ncbi:MAG: F0F1 ATP synthase subunit B [Clostridiaceae bacterium]|nr:F0F1 ATP synthase subunit B [Eubacteriales bacterium]
MEFKLLDFAQYILNLVVLFIILRAILYKPVKNFMQARQDRIQKQQDDARAALREAQGQKLQYDALLNDSRTEAGKLMEQSRSDAEKSAEAILREAQEQARKIIEEARERAAAERAEALAGVRGEAAGLSLELASKILAREVSAQDNARLIDEYFSKVG